MSKLPHHPLETWLFVNQEKASAFASRAGISHAILSKTIRWKQRPTLKIIDKIEAATNGEITAKDFPPLPESTNGEA